MVFYLLYSCIIIGAVLVSLLANYALFGSMSLFRVPVNTLNQYAKKPTKAASTMDITVPSIDSNYVRSTNTSMSSPAKDNVQLQPTQYCHLDDLNLGGPVHLWTMVAASSPNILRHFILHYSALGISKQNMFFLTHAISKTEEEQIFSILIENGIDPISQTKVTRSYSSNEKMSSVNDHIRNRLSSDSWLVYPDVDEFFHLPCKIPDRFKGICGKMVDRFHSLNEGDIIPFIDESEKALPEQFPYCYKVRGTGGKLKEADDRKLLLFPTRVRNGRGTYRAKMMNSHTMSYILTSSDDRKNKEKQIDAGCHKTMGIIDHYSWSSEQVDLVERKKDLYSGFKKYSKENKRKIIYDKLLKFVEQSQETAGRYAISKSGVDKLLEYEVECPDDPTTRFQLTYNTSAVNRSNDKGSSTPATKEPIHVVYSSTDDSIPGAMASIRSLKKHSSGPVQFYFIGNTPIPPMPETEVEFIPLAEVSENFQLDDFLNPAKRFDRRDSINTMHSNFARFVLDVLFPNLTKVMYIDVDTMVLCDAYSLINGVLNNNEYALAAVPRYDKKDGQIIQGLTKKGAELVGGDIPVSFNAGMFVANLDNWRVQGLTNTIRNITLWNKRETLYNYGSQPPLNIAIKDRFEQLPKSWNVKVHKTRPGMEMCLMHWTGPAKPWNNSGNHKKKWLQYGRLADKSRVDIFKKQFREQKRHCHLNELELPGPVYLWTMIAASTPNILRHFLQHYIDYGISAKHMAFLVHANSNRERDEVFSVLSEYGIDPNRQTTVTSMYQSTLKTIVVNKHIEALPEHAWLVNPDLDEFFHFSCTRPRLSEVGCGKMTDRLATIKPYRPIPAINPATNESIAEQFPYCYRLRGKGNLIEKAEKKKIMLFPTTLPKDGKYYSRRAIMKDSQSLIYYQYDQNGNIMGLEDVKCQNVSGSIDHYTISADKVTLEERKTDSNNHSTGRQDSAKNIFVNELEGAEGYDWMFDLLVKHEITGQSALSDEGVDKLKGMEVTCPVKAEKAKRSISNS